MKQSDDYAIYLRKSRKDLDLEALGEGETLGRHKAALEQLADRQGLHIAKIYSEVVSGESIADRPQMQQLLDDVWAGAYAGVLVMEVERLARGNTKDQGEVAEAFSFTNTLIVTPAKTYDPSNEFDEEYFEFGLFMSRREYKTIRRRMQRGLLASIQEGNFVGARAPYGYDIVRINKKERTLVPNDQAKYVKMIFDWYVRDGLSCNKITRQLEESGIPSPSGGREWDRTAVNFILKNPIYTGVIVWYKRKIFREKDETGRTIKRAHKLRPEDRLVVEGKHPAIISNEAFATAQSLFARRAPLKSSTALVNPLAHLVYCKHCGKAMIYYAYRNRAKGRITHKASQVCTVKSSTLDDVMTAVAASLRDYIEDYRFKSTNDGEVQKSRQREEMLHAMESELEKLEKQREKLFDFLESGVYTTAEFIERKNAVMKKIRAMQDNIDEFRENLPPPVDYQEKILQVSEALGALEDPDVPVQAKNDLLMSIISRIEYDCIDYGRRKGGEIHLDVYMRE